MKLYNTSLYSLLLKLSHEELERRRVRRERNKLAAAKCRNRRRELTDSLQSVSIEGAGLSPIREDSHSVCFFSLLSPGVGDRPAGG